jgi:hypothetical protein
VRSAGKGAAEPPEPRAAVGKAGAPPAAAALSGHPRHRAVAPASQLLRSVEQRTSAQVAAVVAELGALDLERAPLAALTALLTACAGTETRIAVRVASAAAEPPAPAGPETFISVKAAAARIAKSPKWLYRRKHRLPFLCELEPGSWGVHVPTLERWMTTRTRR